MMRIMKIGLASMVAIAASAPVQAGNPSYDMVVLHAENASLARGTVIDGNRALKLSAGAKVTLVGANGFTVNLKGPFEAKPAQWKQDAEQSERSGNNKVVEILSALLTNESRSSKALGVVRSANGASSAQPPHEWAVNIAQSGTKCIGSDVALLWRGDASQQGSLEIRRVGSARTAKAIWPEGQEFVAINRKVFDNGESYIISLDGNAIQIKVNVLPKSFKSSGEQAAWMAKSNCKDQALAMVERIR